MTLTTVLIDISAISVLLLLAFLIRQKIPFFYKYYHFFDRRNPWTAFGTAGTRTVFTDPSAA